MASSGFMSTNNAYVKYWIEVSPSSPDIVNNRTWVEVKVWAKRTNSGFTTSGTGSVTLKVDGSYYNSSTTSISINSNSVVYHSWSGYIQHGGDGSKTLTCSAAININGILSSSEQSYSETLTSIARTSTFTINKSSCELGTPFVVTINRADPSFTHSVSYCIGGSGGERRYMQNWDSASTTASYSPPITDAVYAPNSTSAGVSIVVDTYKNSTFIGSTSATLIITIPSSVTPSFTSITATRVGTNPWNKYVQGKSQCTLTINGASGSYGSSISKYSITGGGFSSTASSFTTNVLPNSGTVTFTATITDSRGRTATGTTSITVEPYANPVITSFTTERCNSNGTLNDDGIYVKCVGSYTVSSITNNNKSSYFRYRQVGTTSWSSNTTGTTAILSNIDTNTSYEVQFVASDYFTSSDKINIVNTAFVTMDFKAGGKGVAIGKVSQADNLFDVAMPTMVRNTLEITMGVKSMGSEVVESGSGVNGDYTKYYDGTLICRKRVTQSMNITNAWGSFFESTTLFDFGSWEYSFVGANPKITVANVGAWCDYETVTGTTTTAIGRTYIYRHIGGATNVSVTMSVVGYGRWKA